MLRTIAVLSVAVMAAVGSAHAQTWPQKPMTFIVSSGGGSSPDIMARLVSARLEKILGQAVVINNMPGAGNVIGARAAARAAPDGYTYFFATSASLANNPFMVKNLPYDPVKDFAPIALITRSNQLIVVKKDLPARTFAELIAIDKSAPGKISMAVDGPRNLAGITAAAIDFHTGTKFTMVPYPNPPVGVQDVLAGRTDAGVFSISIVEAQVRDGGMRALAVAANKRISAFPDLPTAAETIPGFDFGGWFMLMAPTGTPPDIVKRMNAALDEAVKDPSIRDMAPKLGFELDPKGVGSPADAAAFLQTQLTFWEKTLKDLKIEAE